MLAELSVLNMPCLARRLPQFRGQPTLKDRAMMQACHGTEARTSVANSSLPQTCVPRQRYCGHTLSNPTSLPAGRWEWCCVSVLLFRPIRQCQVQLKNVDPWFPKKPELARLCLLGNERLQHGCIHLAFPCDSSDLVSCRSRGDVRIQPRSRCRDKVHRNG